MPLPKRARGRAWQEWVVQWDVSHFAIALAFSAFATMWMSICVHYHAIAVPVKLWYSLWGVALLVLALDVALYLTRLYLFRQALSRDFHNPKLVNFFFTPVVIGSLLVISTPPPIKTPTGMLVAFYVLAAYQLTLFVYLSGEWLFGTHLIDFVHPVVFLQVIGFFLLSIIASLVFHREEAIALFAVGALFWILIFVTNFQHCSSCLKAKQEFTQPTFCLFIAPPAQATIASLLIDVALTQNSYGSKFLAVPDVYKWPVLSVALMYIDLFFYLLILRIFPTFWNAKFSIQWWAYIFPLSAAAATTVWRYGSEHSRFWAAFSAVLVIIATAAMIVVSVATCRGMWAGQLPKNSTIKEAYRSDCACEDGIDETEDCC